MIGFVAGVVIGLIVGWAVSAWQHASIASSPASSVGFSAIGLGNGRAGHYLDAHHARLLKPILEQLGREVM